MQTTKPLWQPLSETRVITRHVLVVGANNPAPQCAQQLSDADQGSQGRSNPASQVAVSTSQVLIKLSCTCELCLQVRQGTCKAYPVCLLCFVQLQCTPCPVLMRYMASVLNQWCFT